MIVKDVFQSLKTQFLNAGMDTAALDARILICHVLNVTHEEFLLSNERKLFTEEMHKINDVAAQRLLGKPVAKIIGHKEFYGRDFITTTDTLDPRPDSEILIETVLQHSFDKPRLLDLGTGTGCLVLTLLAELPMARAIAVDQSREALDIAKRNAWLIGVEDRIVFVKSDWFSEVVGTFDVILSNPPYIPEGDLAGLSREVRLYDPTSALTGGQDGLDPYRVIIPQLHNFLKPGGMVIFELGQGQAGLVADMLEKAGFSQIFTKDDLGGIARVVGGFWLQNPVDSVS